MAVRGIAQAQTHRVNYLFIDGAYLDGVLEELALDLWGPGTPPVDLAGLSHGYEKTFYYNCPPPALKDESETDWLKRCAPYFSRLQRLAQLSGWHIFEGTVKRHKKRGPTQKEVDVQLAVDLLTHSFKGNMDRATLLAGDQDFRPVVEAVSREGMFITVWSEARSSSAELRSAADERLAFDLYTLTQLAPHNWSLPYQLPDHGYARSPIYELSEWWMSGESGSRSFTIAKKPDGRFHAFINEEHAPGVYEFFAHQDVEILKKFLQSAYREIKWLRSREAGGEITQA